VAVDRNRICYRSNSVEEDMRLINAFKRNRIEGNICSRRGGCGAEAEGAEIKLFPGAGAVSMNYGSGSGSSIQRP
jgi:hypothetical protein